MGEPLIRQISIAEDVMFGDEVVVVKPVNLYGCSIGDRTFIGPFVEIQKGVIIGRDCRVQSHAFICSGVTIGDDCFIGHGTKFVNDLFKHGDRARGDTSLYGRTEIGDHVCIGTNVTILPVRIADHVCIGAGSVVTRDLLEPGIYYGSPAKLHRKTHS